MMLYRKFGKTNEEVSVLGVGCMRLPVIDDEQLKRLQTEVIDYYLVYGLNRFFWQNLKNVRATLE